MQINYQKLFNVISCSRCSTKDGYSTIEAVVELSKDTKMVNVDQSVRLTFRFRREKIYKESIEHEKRRISRSMSCTLERKQQSPTLITYDIDYSKDHGENKRLITIEVHAKNDFPSVEPALPMEDENSSMEDMEEIDKEGRNMKSEINSEMNEETMSVDNETDADRYAAYVDPDALQEFLQSVNLEFNAENSLFFLMTFPFYEHEWDIFGFLLDCVFGEDEDSEGYEDMTDSDEDDDL